MSEEKPKESKQDSNSHCESNHEDGFTTPCGKKVNCSSMKPCKFIGMGMSLFMIAMLFYILGRISADLF